MKSFFSQISDLSPPAPPAFFFFSLLFVEGLSGTLCWPGALPCPGKGKGQVKSVAFFHMENMGPSSSTLGFYGCCQ